MTLGAALGIGLGAELVGSGISFLGTQKREKAQEGVGNQIAEANASFFKKRGALATGAAGQFRNLGKAFGDSVQSNFEARTSEARVRRSQKAFDEREASVNNAVQEQLAQAALEEGAAGGALNPEQKKTQEGTREQAQPLEQALVGASAAQAAGGERGTFDLEQAGILSRALGELGAQGQGVQGLADIQSAQLGLDQQNRMGTLQQAMQRAGEAGSGQMILGNLVGSAGQIASGAVANSALKKEAEKKPK